MLFFHCSKIFKYFKTIFTIFSSQYLKFLSFQIFLNYIFHSCSISFLFTWINFKFKNSSIIFNYVRVLIFFQFPIFFYKITKSAIECALFLKIPTSFIIFLLSSITTQINCSMENYKSNICYSKQIIGNIAKLKTVFSLDL